VPASASTAFFAMPSASTADAVATGLGGDVSSAGSARKPSWSMQASPLPPPLPALIVISKVCDLRSTLSSVGPQAKVMWRFFNFIGVHCAGNG
jgi:hypothetical protein